MSRGFDMQPDRTDELGRDMFLAEQLSALDPASQDANYWLRFRSRVMSDAARSLAQRRILADLTVADVVTSWARTIVPTAALAAALAGIVLVRSGTMDLSPAPVAEVIVPVTEVGPLPRLLAPESAMGFAALVTDAF